jgi:hypothetical protein
MYFSVELLFSSCYSFSVVSNAMFHTGEYSMQTIKRNWLKAQVEAGKIEAKCDFHFIDGLPDATQGRTEWMLARIRRPRFERIQYDDGTVGHERCMDHDFIEGQMNFNDSDFEGNSGSAYWEDEAKTRIHFRIHSNAFYTLRIKSGAPEVTTKSVQAPVNATPSTMTLEHTKKRVSGTTVNGTGVVLYGTNAATGKWFQRRFEMVALAMAYATKQGWMVNDKTTPSPVVKPRIRVYPTVTPVQA